MRGILIKPVSSRGHSGEDLEILRSFLCRFSSIPHQAIHGFQIRYAISVFLHYYVLCSNMVIYVDLNVSYILHMSKCSFNRPFWSYPQFWSKALFDFVFLVSFPIFIQKPFISLHLHFKLSHYSILTYKLLVLCHLGPYFIIYPFTLDY